MEKKGKREKWSKTLSFENLLRFQEKSKVIYQLSLAPGRLNKISF